MTQVIQVQKLANTRKKVISSCAFTHWPCNHTFRCLASVRSWKVEFIGNHALHALESHVSDLLANPETFGPYCPIVQSSGMGKSRLIDEFSRHHFTIPINLRNQEKDAGGNIDPPFLPLWPLHTHVYRFSSSRPRCSRFSHQTDGRSPDQVPNGSFSYRVIQEDCGRP